VEEVKIDGRLRLVPATWNELSRPLLLRVLAVLYGPNADVQQLRIKLLAVLLQVPLALVVLHVTPVQVVQIQWLTNFLLEELTLTAQLLPWLKRPGWRHWLGRRWWGPRESLRNVSFAEFIFADAYFVAYARSQEPAHLDQLVAVLYRPQRADYDPTAVSFLGDRREDFNEHLVPARARCFAALDMTEKLAVLTWYRGCRLQLERDYPLVFEAPEGVDVDPTGGGWGQVLRELSGQAFGTLQETKQQPIRLVLAKLQDDAHRAKELARQARENAPT
jgi:hypothetical protein